jgi:signal peptidase II
LRLATVVAAVVALDQWTKHWATRTLAFQPPVEVIDGFVRLTYTRNSGVAFGIGAGLPLPYYLFSIAAVAVILYLFTRQRVRGWPRQLALALILGGAIGNLIDRLRFGEVVDFIEVGIGRLRWPVFNVADSAVSIGVVLFALTWPRRQDHPPQEAELPTPAGPAPPSGPSLHDPHLDPRGAHPERGGAAGPLPGERSGGPLS